ncbi:hypothetical protein MC885_010636, partial [Smutsia gigantea]
MTSEGAFPVLGLHGSVNLGAFVSSFTVLPSAPPVPGPPHRAPWQQRPPNLPGPVLPPGSALVLPAFPSTPLVAGEAGRGPGWPGAYNITIPVRLEQTPVQAPQAQTILTQAPVHGSTPGTLRGGAVCPVPQFMVATVVEPILPGPHAGGTQASYGGWSLHCPPQAAVPAAQLASGELPAMAGPRPHGAARSGGPACWPPTTSPGNACTRTSVYKKYRRWQHYKPLARRHLPHSPDTEALSCFLIPVLRTLAGLKPIMTREEGLSWALQEWQHQSNSDRRIYYEMAAKFMEFEAEEAVQIQKAQWMTAAWGLPPPATHRPGSRAPPAPELGQKRGEWATVWAVLHPHFLADVLSPEPQLVLCALAEELEQEEGLSLTQLQQKRLLALKQEEGVQAPPSHGTPRLDSRPSEMETGQDSQRHGHGPQRGDSDQ